MKRAVALMLVCAMALSVPAFASPSQIRQLLSVARDQLGAPYKLDSDAPNSFNCFSFVAYCFNQVVPGTITAKGIHAPYDKVSSMSDLRPGDLVGFKGARRLKGILGYHFGIYIGRGYFVHAANADKGVTVSRMKDYKKRFVGAVRIL